MLRAPLVKDIHNPKDELQRLVNNKINAWRRQRIHDMIEAGEDYDLICRNVGVSKNGIQMFLRAYGYINRATPVHFGFKDEAYMSEDEMLKEFTVDPSDLKGWELEQYNK